MLLIVIAATALAAVLPVTSLFDPVTGGLRPRVRLAPPGGRGDLGLGWTAPVQLPGETQQQAVDALAAMLLGIAVATLATAAIIILVLSVTRESERAGEIRVQRAVGASRRLLLGSALLEGALLALGGVVLGGITGLVLVRIAAPSWPGRVLPGSLAATATAALAVAAMVVVGAVLPVLLPRRRIKEAEAHSRTPLAPVALQLGVSLVALTTGALVARHAAGLMAGGASRVIDGAVLPIVLPDTGPAERAASYTALLQDLKAGAKFDSVSLTNPGALVGLGPVSLVTTDCGRCSEGGIWLPWRVKPATHQFVTADTFRLLGVKLVAGRGITSLDRWSAPRVAVVSRSLAAREFQHGEAIGRQIRVVDDGAQWSTVVGVVEDPRPVGLGGALQPRYTVYLSILQHPPQAAELLIRGSPRREVGAVARPIIQAALGTPVTDAWQSESALLATEAAPLAWFGRWFGLEGWAMLGLALVGSFALMGLWVRSLLGELGVRRALGARRRHLVGLVFLHAAGVGVAGIATGVWFGSATWSVLSGVMSGLPAWDTGIVARFAVLLVGSALAGALLPAWRAARMTPATLITSRAA